MISYSKGIPLCLATTAIAVVPSALYHGSSLTAAALLSVAATALMIFTDWANAWRYRWEPQIRARWFYVNLTTPAVIVLTIQAIGWRVFVEGDSTPVIQVLRISVAHFLACLAAIVAVVAWVIFSSHLRKKEPNQAPQRNAGSRPSSSDPSASETLSSLGPRG